VNISGEEDLGQPSAPLEIKLTTHCDLSYYQLEIFLLDYPTLPWTGVNEYNSQMEVIAIRLTGSLGDKQLFVRLAISSRHSLPAKLFAQPL
jgi:hypothetical protein